MLVGEYIGEVEVLVCIILVWLEVFDVSVTIVKGVF